MVDKASGGTYSHNVYNYYSVLLTDTSGTEISRSHSSHIDKTVKSARHTQTKKSNNTNNNTIHINKLRLKYHNVYGLSQADLDENIEHFSNLDFFAASETWLDENSPELSLAGFRGFPYHRPVKHINARRGSGGMYVFIRNSILNGVTILHNHKDLIAWFKFDKLFFGFKADLYVAACYIAPPDSPHFYPNSFSIIQDDISRLPSRSRYMLLLDGNAHTNVCEDFISDIPGNDCGLSDLVDTNFIDCPLPKSVKKRISSDTRPLDDHGRNLVNLCKSSDMFIGNSRLPGNDLNRGSITWISRGNPNHTGVLDYALLSYNLLEEVEAFNIGNFMPFSDHAPIEISLKCNIKNIESKKITKAPTTWEPMYKYQWKRENLTKLKLAISDTQSKKDRQCYRESMSELMNVDIVANKFDDYVANACSRVFRLRRCKPNYNSTKGLYIDSECRAHRAEAIEAGARVYTPSDRMKHMIACKKYKAIKQRKKRVFQAKSIRDLNKAFGENPSSIWETINKFNINTNDTCEPEGDEFFNFYSKLSKSADNSEFSKEYENIAKQFILERKGCEHVYSDQENEILNRNFTTEEVALAIDLLKTGRSAGADFLPPEFIKHLKEDLKCDITDIFNYIIEKRTFPKKWAEGIKSSIYKAGDKTNPNNYRGITVPRIFEKIFEQVIMNRLQFLNEAFNHIDETNGGFLKGRRTSDNIFILQGLIQKQLLMGQKLFVCFIDFSKAFDLISRYILFYKLMKGGWGGRVIETFKDLYEKTEFRVKCKGKISSYIENSLGVNQGGIASGLLFRKYMADLSEYLRAECGILIGEEVLTHLLWADDLVLISDSLAGIKKQLAGLDKFCNNNHMIINELKTKLMVFGCKQKYKLFFKGSLIEQVVKYKFLGTIFKAVHRANSDPFSLNYEYLCDKARKSLFAIKHKLRHIGHLPPSMMFYIYNSALKPILCYASDVWGFSSKGRTMMDKFFLQQLKYTLGIRQSASTLLVIGETGQILPSVNCDYNIMTYFNRLMHMNDNTIVKQVFNELESLHKLGFSNWYSNANGLISKYNLNLNHDQNIFKIVTKLSVEDSYKRNWFSKIHDSISNPIARTYKHIKLTFGTEKYLHHIQNFRVRKSITQLRTSTHKLLIETSRHQKHTPDISERNCKTCNTLEDEIHFLTSCSMFEEERKTLFSKLGISNMVASVSQIDLFCYLMNITDRCHLKLLANFVHKCFLKRNIDGQTE